MSDRSPAGTPIKRGTARRLGLRLPFAYRQRWMVSFAEVAPSLTAWQQQMMVIAFDETRRWSGAPPGEDRDRAY